MPQLVYICLFKNVINMHVFGEGEHFLWKAAVKALERLEGVRTQAKAHHTHTP